MFLSIFTRSKTDTHTNVFSSKTSTISKCGDIEMHHLASNVRETMLGTFNSIVMKDSGVIRQTVLGIVTQSGG